MIYKLAKTSPLISGQVRWDMCLRYKNIDLGYNPTVDELHIVPISDNIIYNEDNSRSTYNYHHTDNIKRLYKNIEHDFYSDAGKYDTKYWVYNEGNLTDPFDNTYKAGCHRIRYERYNRQFSYLCPMWISEELDYSKLKFRIILTPPRKDPTDNPAPLCTSDVVLGDDFIKYISEYMGTSASGGPVSDDLVCFKLDPVSAYVSGVQVTTGHYQITNIIDTLRMLMERERPLMEFDDIILRSFEQHKMISQQLINFNLVFNLSDICDSYSCTLMEHQKFNIAVDVYYDDELVPLKDIYTNYTSIPAYDLSTGGYVDSINVLDYLNDNMCIDLAHTNKIRQCIFHWSLLENPNVIYNMYDGFGPVICDNNQQPVIHLNGMYQNQSMVKNIKYNYSQNSLGWCKVHHINTPTHLSHLDEIMTDLGNSTLLPTSDGLQWVNNNKYNIKIDEYESGKEYRCALFLINSQQTMQYIVNASQPGSMFRWYYVQNHPLGLDLYYRTAKIAGNDVVMFASNSADALVLYNIMIACSGEQSIEDPLKILTAMYNGWEPPHKIEFYKSIVPEHISFDDSISTMIEYRKKNSSHYSYVYRYTGNIIPCFIDMDNDHLYSYDFRYKQWPVGMDKDDDLKEYNRLVKAGYEPKYINEFYSFVHEPFRTLRPQWYTDVKWDLDVSWVDDSILINLPTQIDDEITLPSSASDEEIESAIWDELYLSFKWLGTDDSIKSYLKSRYYTSVHTEYTSGISEIKYSIKYKLR